ncbi:MAG TPA: hypothetical protein VNN07_04545 [Candidatus Tectomicrobia bacterium]|nr:hypothetical protein [Candidatus Tectomicrobia bacterium]
MQQVATLSGNRFQLEVMLKEGVNQVRVMAADATGQSSEDSVTVQYTPPRRHAITILAPADGFTLHADAPPAVLVQGKVDDPRLGAVWLSASGRRWVVPVVDGRFATLVPVLQTSVRIWAQAAAGDDAEKSVAVTVHAPPAPPTAVVVVESLTGEPGRADAPLPPVTVSWRGQPDRLDGFIAPVTLHRVTAPETSTQILFTRNLRAGAYTFRNRAAMPGAAPTTLLVSHPAGVFARDLRGGSQGVVRLLMPYGVFWDQTDWFTGQSQGSDTITKFRVPDGVVWIERKGVAP